MPTQVIKKNGVVYETQLFLSADNCVYVVADGVKTQSTLLNELFALVDSDRITRNSVLVLDGQQVLQQIQIFQEH